MINAYQFLTHILCSALYTCNLPIHIAFSYCQPFANPTTPGSSSGYDNPTTPSPYNTPDSPASAPPSHYAAPYNAPVYSSTEYPTPSPSGVSPLTPGGGIDYSPRTPGSPDVGTCKTLAYLHGCHGACQLHLHPLAFMSA